MKTVHDALLARMLGLRGTPECTPELLACHDRREALRVALSTLSPWELRQTFTASLAKVPDAVLVRALAEDLPNNEVRKLHTEFVALANQDTMGEFCGCEHEVWMHGSEGCEACTCKLTDVQLVREA